jgi:hypothetical protein
MVRLPSRRPKRRPNCGLIRIIASNRELDYALLRLADSAALTGREHVSVMRERPDLLRGARLNIVQCPGGGSLRYAIRTNFFVGYGNEPNRIRYLTDTLHPQALPCWTTIGEQSLCTAGSKRSIRISTR